MSGFNSRAREGRDARWPWNASETLFQFTRPRGARHAASFPNAQVTAVSIHAPARGATYGRARCCASECFNSRAREGRDLSSRARASHRRCFNSRAREGRDMKLLVFDGFRTVSIHAPARGATLAPTSF